jgi:hypothetical protein
MIKLLYPTILIPDSLSRHTHHRCTLHVRVQLRKRSEIVPDDDPILCSSYNTADQHR